MRRKFRLPLPPSPNPIAYVLMPCFHAASVIGPSAFSLHVSSPSVTITMRFLRLEPASIAVALAIASPIGVAPDARRPDIKVLSCARFLGTDALTGRNESARQLSRALK